jgi:hypothetical protein
MGGPLDEEVRMGTMAIPDHTGHTAVAWHPDDEGSVEAASRTFADLAGRRLVAFARATPTDEFAQIRAFDPSAAEIMWVRPLQGG